MTIVVCCAYVFGASLETWALVCNCMVDVWTMQLTCLLEIVAAQQPGIVWKNGRWFIFHFSQTLCSQYQKPKSNKAIELTVK